MLRRKEDGRSESIRGKHILCRPTETLAVFLGWSPLTEGNLVVVDWQEMPVGSGDDAAFVAPSEIHPFDNPTFQIDHRWNSMVWGSQ